ncbi:hypothetical protein ACP70R_041343 [Stipagrostis hirtigluma subsp. patula]
MSQGARKRRGGQASEGAARDPMGRDATEQPPHFLSSSQRKWLCESTDASVFNIEILVHKDVAKAARGIKKAVQGEASSQVSEEGDEASEGNSNLTVHCSGFAIHTNDRSKLRILSSIRVLEKFEKSVRDTYGDFKLETMKKAFEFMYLCIHECNEHRRKKSEYFNYQPIDVLDVDIQKSLVVLEIDVNDAIDTCKENHPGIKMAGFRPAKGEQILLKAWPPQCPNVAGWSKISNNLDRKYKHIFKTSSGGYNMDMNMVEFNMAWENENEETFEQFSGGPMLNGNAEFFGVFYGVHDQMSYATSFADVKSFLKNYLDDEQRRGRDERY